MEFCPTCGMLLQYEMPHMHRPARFFCPICPYVAELDTKVKLKRKQHLIKKKIDPIVSKDDFNNSPVTEARCPQCGFREAFFHQMQLRSADEPMTIFYMCKNQDCGFKWRDD